MGNTEKKTALDPNFAHYRYAGKKLISIHKAPKAKSGVVTKLFLGEWMKILENPTKHWLKVRYRGGEGYVHEDDISVKRKLEIFFIDVNQGDSILIQTPDDRRILIDGGKTQDAYQFVKNKYRLDKDNNYIDFDAIIATHSDNDHTQGLIKLLKDPKIAIKAVYHNGLFRKTDSKIDPGTHTKHEVFDLIKEWPTAGEKAKMTSLMNRFINAAKEAKDRLPKILKKMEEIPSKRWNNRIDFDPKDFVFKRLDTSMKYLPLFDDKNKYLTIPILWPVIRKKNQQEYLPWYADAGKTVNGNSIVLMIQHGKNRILLTGDLNEHSMTDILKKYQNRSKELLKSHVYKAAHHGSQHYSLDFLKVVAPHVGVISSGDTALDKHGHPRAVLLGTITRYSNHSEPGVFSTELAACYKKLSSKEQRKFKAGKDLYERAIKGIIHLRSDGEELIMGRVFGKDAGDDQLSNKKWKWDIWPRG